ncbi:MAG: hypothetical protein ACKOK8_17095, partial [Planctomycetia bacterium]
MNHHEFRPPAALPPAGLAGAGRSQAVVGGFPWAASPAAETEPDARSGTSSGTVGDTRGGQGGPSFAGLPRVFEPVSRPAADTVAQDRPPVSLRERVTTFVRQSPAFSVSLALHCLLLLLLAVWAIREQPVRKLRLRLAFGPASVVGEEAGIAIVPVREPDPKPEEMKTELAKTELPPVPEPQSAPVLLHESTDGPAAEEQPTFVAPAVGMLLAGRDAGSKQVLVAAAGGSDATENAVALALEWLRRQQGANDGLWSLTGPYGDGGSQENQLAATAMALLAFQGAGNTTTQGPYHAAVARAWRSLLKLQQEDGTFDVGNVPLQHALYSHAQATMALCELYGMSRDPKLAEAAARAVGYCVAAQGPNGGWRYEPGKAGDMSVTGWYMMALKTAEMAGLEVPAETFARIGDFLDTVANEKRTAYGYLRHSPLKPASPVTAAVTAEGLLCRQYLGWPQADPRLVEGIELLLNEKKIDFAEDGKDVYAWYYITQVAHHMEGDAWRRWNEQVSTVLPREQVAKGREKGSWDPALDKWGHIGGRLFAWQHRADLLVPPPPGVTLHVMGHLG